MAIHLDSNKRLRPYDSLGEAIKHFRKKANLTQEKLAEKIDVCQASIAHYEANRVTPPLKVLKNISRELNCSLALLVDHKLQFGSEE